MSIEQFAQLVQEQTLETTNKRHPGPLVENPDFWLMDATTHIKPGKKYTKVDVGRSGAFMIVNETGEIFGIKAYGVIHRGHAYGTLETVDNWYWGEFHPYPKKNQPPATGRAEREDVMSKHTPEQWKIKQNRGNNRYEYTWYEWHKHTDDIVIAEIEFTDAETAKELSRLIEAGPSLLAACKDAFDCATRTSVSVENTEKRRDSVIANLKAAIRKTEVKP